MYSVAQLEIDKGMKVVFQITMTVGEMDALLAEFKDLHRWPISDLKNILQEPMSRMYQAFRSTVNYPRDPT